PIPRKPLTGGTFRRSTMRRAACARPTTVRPLRTASAGDRLVLSSSPRPAREGTMSVGPPRPWIMAATILVPCGTALAQAPPDACALMSGDEFEALTGRTEYTEPTGMPWGSGTVCGYANGQIVLFTGEDSRAAFDRLLAGFG